MTPERFHEHPDVPQGLPLCCECDWFQYANCPECGREVGICMAGSEPQLMATDREMTACGCWKQPC